MEQVNSAFALVGHWLLVVLGVLTELFAAAENAARSLLDRAGVPGNIQTVVLLVVAVLFIVLALRVFGGLLRLLLILFFILWALHILGVQF